LLADVPDRERRDGGPELVIRRKHPVVAMPVLPRRRDEIGEPVEEPAPDARAAPPEAHESLIGRKTVEEVPLTGLSFGPNAHLLLGNSPELLLERLTTDPLRAP